MLTKAVNKGVLTWRGWSERPRSPAAAVVGTLCGAEGTPPCAAAGVDWPTMRLLEHALLPWALQHWTLQVRPCLTCTSRIVHFRCVHAQLALHAEMHQALRHFDLQVRPCLACTLRLVHSLACHVQVAICTQSCSPNPRPNPQRRDERLISRLNGTKLFSLLA